MSNISIIRWFLRTINKEALFLRNDHIFYKIVVSKSIHFDIRLVRIVNSYNDDRLIMDYCYQGKALRFFHRQHYWGNIVIQDIEEFLNSDDMILVLKYGRVITDETFIHNLNSNGINITLEEFLCLIQ